MIFQLSSITPSPLKVKCVSPCNRALDGRSGHCLHRLRRRHHRGRPKVPCGRPAEGEDDGPRGAGELRREVVGGHVAGHREGPNLDDDEPHREAQERGGGAHLRNDKRRYAKHR